MPDINDKPVIFLAFANNRRGALAGELNLPEEERRVREVLEAGENEGLCELVVRSNCTAGDIFKVLQDPRYRDRVAVFHYGGHATSYQLLLETRVGNVLAADAGGLAAFLGQQQGLHLVFLNGCSTQQQTQGLLEANIPAVLATSRAIDDTAAIEFSVRFYNALSRGANLRTAYNEASAALRTTAGEDLRGLYFDDSDRLEDHRNARGLPWNLYLREGIESADEWNLPEAVNDPLFGLPPLPEQDLPESPYRRLDWFTYRDAEVFFGRGHQIRELYERATTGTQPIILLYGQTGVGKSSLLNAGLIPRLERDHQVTYLRRSSGGLLATLQSELLKYAPDASVENAWLASEQRLVKPLTIVLDQAEEFYTRSIAELPDELEQFLRVLDATFGDPRRRPQGKLVLGFREEWLAKLEASVKEYQLPRTKVFLKPLDRRGIIEVVEGPTRTRRVRERYALTIEDGLAEMIAGDLLMDRDSAISPTLQILLSKMWNKVTQSGSGPPRFTQALYLDMKRSGILLGDTFEQQLKDFRKLLPKLAESGLLLDVLARHTTNLGTADQCGRQQLLDEYGHVRDKLPALLQRCQDLYLLTEVVDFQQKGGTTTRLAHDILAPLVRERFDRSERPGQLARRILDAKCPATSLTATDTESESPRTPTKGTDVAEVLSERELDAVLEGKDGTRQWNDAEEQLVNASLLARRRRQRQAKLLRRVTFATLVLIISSAGFAFYQWHVASEGRKSYLAQKNWGNQRVDHYQRVLRLIQQQIRTIKEETTDKLAPPGKQLVEQSLDAVQTEMAQGLSGVVLSDSGPVRVVRVHFVTTRNLKDTGIYGHDRNTDGTDYGYLDVSFPPNHLRGKIESPATGASRNLSLHVEMQTLQQTSVEGFREQLRWRTEELGHGILVFVHSWNMSFEATALRAAQLALDLDFDGEVVLFAWPSRESTWAYLESEEQLVWSEPAFVEMLDELADVADGENIHLFGHALGARLVANGCVQWLNIDPESRRVGQVVLAAADIPSARFRDLLAPRLVSNARGVTVYVSSDDAALLAAGQIHGSPAIGAEVVLIPGVVTIEVPKPNTDLIGHAYYATSGSVLDDMMFLLRGIEASKRALKLVNGHYRIK